MNKRFFEKVAIKAGNECWEWQGSRLKSGYGQTRAGTRMELTHRMMYIQTVGEIPKGMVIMHTCDNPPCCNPNHLKLGTYKDNAQDMIQKGRSVYTPMSGESNPNVTVSAEQVAEIRLLYKGVQHKTRPKTGPTLKELAVRFKIGISQVKRIISNESWKVL